MTSPLSLPLAFALGWLTAYAVAWAHHELHARVFVRPSLSRARDRRWR